MRILKDPLWLFLLAGAAIFFVAEWFAEEDIPYEVIVREADLQRLSDQWALQMRRPPTSQELNGLVDQFVKEEIYYREAQRLGLDANDTIVRRRMVQKLTFLTEDIATAIPADEATLRAYYDEHRATYEIPQRFSFQHRYFSSDRRADAETDAQQAVQDSAISDDAFMLQKSYALRSLREIGDLFGSEFAQQLAQLPAAESWQGPIKSAYGWHPIKILAIEDAYIPAFEEVQDRVLIDAQQAARRDANAAYFANLKAKYTVELPAGQP